MSRISEALSSISSQGAITFDSLRRLGEAIERELNERDAAIKKAISQDSRVREEVTMVAPPPNLQGNQGGNP